MTRDNEQEPEVVLEFDEEEVSAPADRERLLAETLAHAEVREAHYKQRHGPEPTEPPWRISLALVLLAAAAWVAVSPPAWATGAPDPVVAPAERTRGERATLALLARAIEAYRFERGRIPESLDELGDAPEGVRYIRSDNRSYQLVTRGGDGSPLVFDSVRPDTSFEEALGSHGRRPVRGPTAGPEGGS